MSYLSKLYKLLYPLGLEKSETDVTETACFNLKYKDLTIGYLELKNRVWHFRYSDEFKKQNSIAPLPDYPNVDKIYANEELWPFFLIRIPNLKQPRVQKIISKENIDHSSQVELLKRFGKKTISNPFELTYS
jgi:HipA-like protein